MSITTYGLAFLAIAMGLLVSMVPAQAEMTLEEAQSYLTTQKQAYESCQTDSDCTLATTACGGTASVNTAEYERYSEANRVYSQVIDCVEPENPTNPVPVCEQQRCTIKGN